MNPFWTAKIEGPWSWKGSKNMSKNGVSGKNLLDQKMTITTSCLASFSRNTPCKRGSKNRVFSNKNVMQSSAKKVEKCRPRFDGNLSGRRNHLFQKKRQKITKFSIFQTHVNMQVSDRQKKIGPKNEKNAFLPFFQIPPQKKWKNVEKTWKKRRFFRVRPQGFWVNQKNT